MIVVENDWGPHAKLYTAKLSKEEIGTDWKTVTLPLSRFVSADGRTPASWKVLDKLEISGKTSQKEPPCFANFHWTEAGG